MHFELHQINETRIVEIISDGFVINNIEDGIDLVGNIYYQDVDKVILHEKNITPTFFDLSTGIAGEVLQKFSNYRIRLAIVGDFSKYTSKSLNDFIYESNKNRKINFVVDVNEAKSRLLSH
ncbi:MAG: DUF4180 domain-containing protein [Bacteroidia bacterium]